MTSESINRHRWQLKNYHWKDKIRELIKSNPLFSDFDDILFEDIDRIDKMEQNRQLLCVLQPMSKSDYICNLDKYKYSIMILKHLAIISKFTRSSFFFFFQDDIFNAVTKNKRVTLLTLNIDKTGKNIMYRWI